MRQGLLLRLALALSTARYVPSRTMPPAEYAMLQTAARSGWRLRRASPRWDAIWHPFADNLSRQRVLILPDRGWGLSGIDWLTIIRARSARGGLTDGFDVAAPDIAQFRQAECRLHDLLAPVWARGRNDPRSTRTTDP